MFTKTQGKELIDNTYYGWTTINGVNGYKFTSKTNASNYIFLSAGGVWDATTHTGVGLAGDHWSTIMESSPLAWYLQIQSNGPFMTHYSRYLGLSIRAIAPPRPW